MIRGLVPAIGLMSLMAPALAHAQTDLDQGKSAAQIFASDCAECHKALHGLANGRSRAALTEFLGEHYTTSRDQAAALAAYVLGGHGSEPIGAGQSKKSGGRASAAAEESRPRTHQRPEKLEDGASAKKKPRQPAEAAAKPKEEAVPDEVQRLLNPILRPEHGQHEQRPAAAARTRRREPKNPPPTPAPAVVHEPASVGAEPAPAESSGPSPPPSSASATPPPAATPAATAPAAASQSAAPTNGTSGEPGENAPVPRDNIPD